ncbi:MAG TPA: hypothetical protein VFI24_08485 [Pyrinomonadaceae bacterium]|nr:hypothetical protein [Pyrinomonadaceae bacterium]
MTDERAAFEGINRDHQVCREIFFSQKDFRRQFNIHLPIGLCAGLIQVWWAELRKGNDAITCLKEATPKLISEVVLSQARSVYLKEFPPLNRDLRPYEIALLRFKYEEESESSISSLCTAFGANNCLELDLALLHDSPIIKRWQFSHSASNIVNALNESLPASLYVLLTRFWDSKRPSAERGHRTALVIEPAGSCRFYDPRWGEMSFVSLDHFTRWFTDYWTILDWDYLLQRGSPPSSPIQLFAFGSTFSPTSNIKRVALSERFSNLNVEIEELVRWLESLRSAASGDHTGDDDLMPVFCRQS